jgi:hypothetical protein
MKPAEVFLSHSDKDRAFATRVRDCLVAHGIPVWRENRGGKTGTDHVFLLDLVRCYVAIVFEILLFMPRRALIIAAGYPMHVENVVCPLPPFFRHRGFHPPPTSPPPDCL